jgi:hypothetical protein
MLLLPAEKRSIPYRLVAIGVTSTVWWMNSPTVYELSTGLILSFFLYQLLWDMMDSSAFHAKPLRAKPNYTV